MHKLVLKMFEILKNLIKFSEIIIIFVAMLMILYWIQYLIGSNWSWLVFFTPVLDFFILVINFFVSIFLESEISIQYSYVGSLLLLVIFYCLSKYVYIFAEILENFYIDTNIRFKKNQEKRFNARLMKVQKEEQNLIKKYVVYISTAIPSRKMRGKVISLDEENKIMNKYLIEKTMVLPEVFEQGFIYKFNDFESIDNVIDIFQKLLKNKKALDYLIIIQACESDFSSATENIKKLMALNIFNKIYFTSDTLYRYNFNKNKKYQASQIGIFQKDSGVMEVSYFIEKNSI